MTQSWRIFCLSCGMGHRPSAMRPENRYKECPSGHPIPGRAYFVYQKRYSGGADGTPSVDIAIRKFTEEGNGKTELIFTYWGTQEEVEAAARKWAGNSIFKKVAEDALNGVSYTGNEKNAKCLKCRRYWIDREYHEYDHFGSLKIMCELELPRSFFCRQFTRRSKMDDCVDKVIEKYDDTVRSWEFDVIESKMTREDFDSRVKEASLKLYALYEAITMHIPAVLA